MEIIKDPRYFASPQKVIFPQAEVKLVTFEFEAVGNDERGKERAKELHKEFLAKIHDLHGGAIITFVTASGQKIENYRVNAEEVAKQQKAQMVLWGRILADSGSEALISARLMLVSAPPGVSAEYNKKVALPTKQREPVEVLGVIAAPITQLRVDFNTVENDVTPLAYFLSGLARYYKGAARKDEEAKRWLRSSINDFKAYVKQVSEKQDAAALGQAYLYLTRAYIRLADGDLKLRASLLNDAKSFADRAAKLNPYDPAVPTVQAVIAVKQQANPSTVRTYLVHAVELAPADANARVNLAVLNSAEGKVGEAIRQLDNADFIQKVQNKTPSPAVQTLRKELQPYQTTRP
jgi:hypothetical protein